MSEEVFVVNYSDGYFRDVEAILLEYRSPSGRTFSRDEIEELISSAVRDQPDGIFLARYGGDVVGLSVASYLDEFGVVFIRHLQVRKDWLDRGVEDKLVNRCLDWAKSRGARIVYVMVADVDRRSIEVYKKNGFGITGYIPHYFKKDVDALIFVRKI